MANNIKRRSSPALTLAIVSVALFMVTLDNLVVTTAIPRIRLDLGATLESLEWTVNAYTLTFAVLLLTGAALGDRFGRRRMFIIGLGIFTVGSIAAALAPTAATLIAARAIQGIGGAVTIPLTLTLLSEAFPPHRRGLALGIWSGISGLAVASGPVVGGAIVEGLSWHWIFWVNVPIGIAAIAIAYFRLNESTGPSRHLDLVGVGLVSTGLLGLVYGVVRGSELGWGSAQIVGPIVVGVVLLGLFIAWEARTPEPMLPLRFFRSRAFSATNGVSLIMFFGIFGSIFLLAQFFQTVQGLSPLEAGIRTLPWTAMPLIVAPIAGVLSDRIGSRPLMVLGLSLQAAALAWIATVASTTVPYLLLIPGFIAGGTGMALVFAPSANAVLASVRQKDAGKASGATNAIRELGGVFGVVVLAAVFAGAGSYASPESFTAGMRPALMVGAAVLAFGALIGLAVPKLPKEQAEAEVEQVRGGRGLVVAEQKAA